MRINTRIIVVEDDPVTSRALINGLKQYFDQLIYFEHGLDAIQWISDNVVSSNSTVFILVCDIGLPDINGFHVINQLPDYPNVGSLLISVKDSCEDKIIGLSQGVDDYVCKPINTTELNLRIESIIRRIKPLLEKSHQGHEGIISFGKYNVCVESRMLKYDSMEIPLTDSEFQFLITLYSQRGKAVNKDTLALRIGISNRSTNSRAVDVLAGRLRKKFGDNPKRPKTIITVRNQGYLLTEK